jgi:chemotaxis protein MotB
VAARLDHQGTDLEGIADYFKTPLKIALAGGEGSGDASSVIKGGGEDLTRKAGQVMRGETETSKDSLSLEKSKADRERVEATKLKDMKSKVEKIIESNKTLNSFKKQFKIDITNEGLRIQIIDDQNRPMFDTGGAVMKPYTREILRAIGQTLNELPNKISLSGHTDAQRYVTGERGYSNWELSADRANASRRELVAGGLEEGKIMRVVGLADAVPFNKDSPTDPVNRRISIIVMNAKAVAAINKESQQIEAATASQIAEQLDNVRK